MAQTTEGRVKEKIKKILDTYKGYIYYEMKVPNGYGAPSLDYFGAARTVGGGGRAFAIEAKRPGGVASARQEATAERMLAGGVRVFLIDGEAACGELIDWLDDIIAGAKL